MDIILNKLRESKDTRNENFSNLMIMIIIVVVLIFGYYIFFFNPDNVLNYIRTPIVVIYVLLIVFILYFIMKRFKEKFPMFNISLELTTHTFTFGKMLLFILISFLSFYLIYNVIVSVVLKTLTVSLFLTIIILVVILSIIDSYTHISDSETPNEIVEFIKDLIFYIPCLLSDSIDFIKKDYQNTPSTVFILFIILIIILVIYFTALFTNIDNPLLLIDKPAYLNTPLISLDQTQLLAKIIESKPWYVKELLRIQQYQQKLFDMSYNYTEGFTSIISQELFPVHLNISEYDKYILKQAIYRDKTILDKINDSSGNNQYIEYIIKKQESLMNLYERTLLTLAYYSTVHWSKMLLGDLNGNRYHYSISFWLYLYSGQTMVGKDTIISYTSRPSMYYDHSTKEIIVEVIDKDNKNFILYRSNNILYQRWNHVVMNYNYGTFDLFINNYLVSTNPGIVSEIKNEDLLQVGFIKNNNLGGITKLTYSDEPLKLHEIEKIYLDKPKI